MASLPAALHEQIGDNGRIVAVIDNGRIGKATLFTRLHGVVGQREMFDAQIPPCPGLVSSPGFAF
jgi:protein-L-isoaspartate(D-aspartate) O-methyltransferase